MDLETLVGGGFLIVMIVLTLINEVLYHKIFRVTYFGARGILREILGCFIAACIEIVIVAMIINKIFGTSFFVN
ncbi:MAG: hypothetical protein LIO94_12185 [Clostridiales bacterium]|nr:hypothetical protein [Clostridiales bacterium]